MNRLETGRIVRLQDVDIDTMNVASIFSLAQASGRRQSWQ